ncbi:hypothetical protein F4801DRAFT_1204 [Xylaria longipes]|nr:hypothetical protein F4801DRAFT_1204 [Xylaria longipes]
MTVETLRSSIEAEGIPAPSQHLYHNGQLITDTGSPKKAGSQTKRTPGGRCLCGARSRTHTSTGPRRSRTKSTTAAAQPPACCRNRGSSALCPDVPKQCP